MSDLILAVLAILTGVGIFPLGYGLFVLWERADKIRRHRAVGDYRTRKEVIRQDGWF